MTTYYTSTYFNSKAIDHVLRNTSFSSSDAWLALYSANPITFGGGGEIFGNNYSRVQVAFTVSGSTAVNTNEIIFPMCSGSAWNVIYYGILDGDGSGPTPDNLLFWGSFPSSKTVLPEEKFFISAGELYIGLGEGYSVYLAGKLLDHVLNDTNYSTPGLNVFAAVYTTLPNKSDGGGTEVNAADYNRLRISGSGWVNQSTIGSRLDTSITVSNAVSLPFCSDTQYSWGTIVGICLRDASSGGNQLLRGAFLNSPTIIVGDSYNIKVGDLAVKLG